MSQKQLSHEDKQKFLAYMEKKRLEAKKSVKTQTKSSNQSQPNLLQWCVEDIVNRLKEVDGLSQETKAKVSTNTFQEILFNDLFEKAMNNIMEPKTTTLDFRFIKNWQEAETSEDKEFLLSAESELNPNFPHLLYRSYIETYIDECISYQIPFNPEVIVPYLAV